ncbi:unnamed protein product [Phytophthora fragariaefolia]|uniref:Unnamed protein product n=1 Tax=Phytophthora fragariaefolia TaxID=1490495 RepID=A0A9W6TLG7_9STRA|nr:unnamed protein product [Phytophthora fragariaefolia]
MPPEEQPSLEDVERTVRRRNFPRRRAAREAKESTEAQAQPDSEPAIQEVHQATRDAGTRDDSVKEPPKGSERDSVWESLGVPKSDAFTPASVGDTVKVAPPAVDTTSEASQPTQDVVTLEDNSKEEPIQLALKDEDPLPAASPILIQEGTQGPSPEVPETSATRVLVDLTEVTDPDAQMQVGEMTAAQAKAYVADQVRRWELVVSPSIEYSRPSPVPDFRPWWVTMMATSEYVASRMSMANPNDAWNSEWNPARLDPSTAVDVTGVMVPPSSLSPRECGALTQTLFFEAGFSLFGTTIADSDESNFSGVSGSRSSGKYSSSSSSMWPFGGAPAGTHRPYAGATGMVMTVQGATFQDASPVGVQVTETILPVPPVLVDQDDVVMSDRAEPMCLTQEALTRKESAQVQQSESLHQAFQAIQALATQASSKEEWITRTLEAQACTSEQTSARPTRIPVAQPLVTSTNIEDIREEEACRAQAHAQAELERRLQQ